MSFTLATVCAKRSEVTNGNSGQYPVISYQWYGGRRYCLLITDH